MCERPKRAAPVEVVLETPGPEQGPNELTLVAIPTRDVDGLELELAGHRVSFGPTRKGVTRTLRATVPARGEAVGSATALWGGRRSMAAAVARQATAAFGPPARVVTLPGGVRVAEGRP